MRRKPQFAFIVGCLLLAGCVDSADTAVAPPVKNALEQMSQMKEVDELARKAKAAAAAQSVPRAEPAADVPQEGQFVVEFETTVGNFTMEVNREWAPIGAHRFYELVKDKFYDDAAFFRVVPGFMVQFGIAADPGHHARWGTEIMDDPVKQRNLPGYVTFAKTGLPNSRTSQIFINYGDNSRLDSDGFAPFGKVTKGMDVVKKISSAHGERPQQPRIEAEGNVYLRSEFPNLDYVKTARLTVDDLASGTDTDETVE